jgi:hypothetical protein
MQKNKKLILEGATMNFQYMKVDHLFNIYIYIIHWSKMNIYVLFWSICWKDKVANNI